MSNKNKKHEPVDINYSTPFPQVYSDANATSLFISGIGIKMQHWAFSSYVLGATDTGSIRNYDEQRVQKQNDSLIYDNNGIYKYMGDVYVIWQGHSKGLNQLPAGYYPESVATVTIDRNYINTNKIVGLSEFDKLIPVIEDDPLEFASVNWEQLQHNPVGIDRLMFKAISVDFCADANGVEYQEGKDFIIENGNIKWLQNGVRPGIDNLSGEGTILSIRYRYIPSFYIKYAAHEIRSHIQIDPITGDRKPIRGPLTAALQIDWVFLQSLKNQESNGDSVKNAGSGGNIGPR